MMKYTDMVKNAERFWTTNPYNDKSDAFVKDYELSNSLHDMSEQDREDVQERLGGVVPKDTFWYRDDETREMNKNFGGMSLEEVENYFRDNSAYNMSDKQQNWFLARIAGLKQQREAEKLHRKVNSKEYVKATASGNQDTVDLNKMKQEAMGIGKDNPDPTSRFDSNKDWLTGAAVGSLAGLTTYGLTELIPMIRRRRFLRALIGLGAGTAAGIGASKLV